MSDENKSKEGPPIWVESLFTPQEYKDYCKKYPQVARPPMHKIAKFNDPKHGRWRYGMGASMPSNELIIHNSKLKELASWLEHIKKIKSLSAHNS